eukprot:scaffold1605_cov340-Prasinococcus_capsulatus_cf.AAC.11
MLSSSERTWSALGPPSLIATRWLSRRVHCATPGAPAGSAEADQKAAASPPRALCLELASELRLLLHLLAGGSQLRLLLQVLLLKQVHLGAALAHLLLRGAQKVGESCEPLHRLDDLLFGRCGAAGKLLASRLARRQLTSELRCLTRLNRVVD